MVTYVLKGPEALASYFTIEFKKELEAVDAAEDQVAAFAALTLYNRVDLRRRSLEAQLQTQRSQSSSELTFADIKHYGLTFAAQEATLFLCRPIMRRTVDDQVLETWHGCTINRLCIINVTTQEGIRELASWVNEIHHWGLTSHANAVEADVKHILMGRKGAKLRVSDIPVFSQPARQPGDDQDS